MNRRWLYGMLRSDDPAHGREIVKIGGSLLELPGWPAILAALVRDRAEARSVSIVVGGGPIVDGLRAIDAVAPRSPATVHALAIELMGTTARLVADALSLPLGTDCDGAAEVLDIEEWLQRAGRLDRLPVGWQVTSDSIAAAVATDTGCDLLLAKRVVPPPCPDGDRIAHLARQGWLDGHFPVAAAGLGRIAWAVPASVPVPVGGGTAGEGVGPRGG